MSNLHPDDVIGNNKVSLASILWTRDVAVLSDRRFLLKARVDLRLAPSSRIPCGSTSSSKRINLGKLP